MTVKEVETVAAVLLPPWELRLSLSNLELILPPLDVGLYLCNYWKMTEETGDLCCHGCQALDIAGPHSHCLLSDDDDDSN